MRISDWSSDVCSSDLGPAPRRDDSSACNTGTRMPSSSARSARINPHVGSLVCQLHWWSRNYLAHYRAQVAAVGNRKNRCPKKKRSEERRDGTESVSTCRYRG